MNTGCYGLASVTLACLFLTPGLAHGQPPSVAIGLNHIFGAQDGIQRNCLEPGVQSTALGARFSHSAIPPALALEFTARAYVLPTSSACVDGFPPPDGTYVQDDRLNLLAGAFLSTDLRLRLRIPSTLPLPTIALGLGNTWRTRHNLPYFLADAQLPIVPLRFMRVSVEGELLYVRIAADRFRRTYENFQVVAVDSLGRVYKWSRAWSFGLQVEVPVRGALK